MNWSKINKNLPMNVRKFFTIEEVLNIKKRTYTYQLKGTAKIYRKHKTVVLGNLTIVENTEDKRRETPVYLCQGDYVNVEQNRGKEWLERMLKMCSNYWQEDCNKLIEFKLICRVHFITNYFSKIISPSYQLYFM